MDFPIFFFNQVGNQLLLEVVGVLFVFISHSIAVGGFPLLVLLEWLGLRSGEKEYDDLAQKINFVFFILLTAFGAVAGIGLWLTSALIGPMAAGSIVRIFFWPLLFQWLVLLALVSLVLIYTLKWEAWSTVKTKRRHLGLGVLIAFLGFLALTVFSSIQGFMMDTGRWTSDLVQSGSMWQAFYNPLYFPQLAFRWSYSMIAGGFMVWMLTALFCKSDSAVRSVTVRSIAIWIFICLPFTIAAAQWYWQAIPEELKAHLGEALMTGSFQGWSQKFAHLMIICASSILIVVLWAMQKPHKVPTALLILPFVLNIWFLGHFEHVRAFMHQPYSIVDYAYANGVRTDEAKIYQRDGILPYATYSRHKAVTKSNQVEAGEDVFKLTCASCHTAKGINGVLKKFDKMYGRDWTEASVKDFFTDMSQTHPYMPLFMGNASEIEALIAFLNQLKTQGGTIEGMQSIGIPNIEYQTIEDESIR